MITIQQQVVADVLAERARQDAKWGQQDHDPFTYLAVLTEEVGELAQAALHRRFGGSKAAGLREEAIHTAAVALAIVECLDRDLWTWPDVRGIERAIQVVQSVADEHAEETYGRRELLIAVGDLKTLRDGERHEVD